MQKELLPLGSVVYLEGATSKLMIVGRGPIFESNGQNVYSDYVGVCIQKGSIQKTRFFSTTKILQKQSLKASRTKKNNAF